MISSMQLQNLVGMHLICLVGLLCQNLIHGDEFFFKYFTIFLLFDGTSQNFCLSQSVMIYIKISKILYAFVNPNDEDLILQLRGEIREIFLTC